jgi:enoyl-CoA hydratase/carnithine racemase
VTDILYAVDQGVATLTFNRPDKLNALTPDMLSSFFHHTAQAAADPDVKVIVITGAGRGFSAGLDLNIIGSGAGSRVELDPGIAPQWGDDIGPEMARFFAGGWNGLITSRKPTIAAINGPAFGWGFILALHCDIRFACSTPPSPASASPAKKARHGSSPASSAPPAPPIFSILPGASMAPKPNASASSTPCWMTTP